jgi:hypothetical protein
MCDFDLQVASLLAGGVERTLPSSSKGSTAGAQHAAAAFDCPSAAASGGLTAPTALVLIFMNRRSKCTMNGAAESIAAAQQVAREARSAIRQTWLASPLVSADLSSSKPLLYRFVVGTHGVTLEEVGDDHAGDHGLSDQYLDGSSSCHDNRTSHFC